MLLKVRSRSRPLGAVSATRVVRGVTPNPALDPAAGGMVIESEAANASDNRAHDRRHDVFIGVLPIRDRTTGTARPRVTAARVAGKGWRRSRTISHRRWLRHKPLIQQPGRAGCCVVARLAAQPHGLIGIRSVLWMACVGVVRVSSVTRSRAWPGPPTTSDPSRLPLRLSLRPSIGRRLRAQARARQRRDR